MNSRKSSLPTSTNEKSFLLKDNSPLKHLWHGAKKRLVASCSKINDDSLDLPSIKLNSFPGSTAAFEASENSSVNSSKSDSSISITDTLLKVRRLTHVYDQDELIGKFNLTPERNVLIDHDEDQFKPTQKVSAKLGDRSYRLPSKAAAILGANDLQIHQLLHDEISPKISHALFLENKVKKSAYADYDLADASHKGLKSKKKTGLGSEVKEKIASLWKQSELSPMSGSGSSAGGLHSSASTGLQVKDMEKLLRAGKASVEQIKNWSHSFECLLRDKFGLAHFHDFLRSEFSDENIEFWIACEEYRTITNPKKLQTRAEKIYNDYVGVQAAREVNLDSKTRQQTEIDIHNPNPHTFDQAQKRIQALMEKDSYQRFLRSEIYGKLLRASEEYLHSQQKEIKEPCLPNRGVIISNLGVTAQDLSKLTLTTSKLALLPHTNPSMTKGQRDPEASKTPLKLASPPEREASVIGTVQPDEPCLPFSKLSLIFTPDDRRK